MTSRRRAHARRIQREERLGGMARGQCGANRIRAGWSNIGRAGREPAAEQGPRGAASATGNTQIPRDPLLSSILQRIQGPGVKGPGSRGEGSRVRG